MASFSSLPRPVVSLILQWLEPLDLIRSAGVCRLWRDLSLSDALWTRFYGPKERLGRGSPRHPLCIHKCWDESLPMHVRVKMERLWAVAFPERYDDVSVKAVFAQLPLPQGWGHAKINLLGQWTSGKTSLALALMGQHPKDLGYLPTTVDYPSFFWAENTLIDMMDNRCGGTDDRLTPLGFFGTSVFLLCFSLADRPTSGEWLDYYNGMAMRIEPEIPRVLVGCKADREDRQVSDTEGESLCARLGCVAYCEVSAFSGQGLRELLKTVVQFARAGRSSLPSKPRKQRCALQ